MWMDVWIRKFLKISGSNPCAGLSEGVKILLSPETGTGRGRLRQHRKDRETGNFGGFLAPVAG
jgi:hypothetical protein